MAICKHTEGPWRVEILDDGFDHAVVIRGHGQSRTVVPILSRDLGFNDDVDERSMANARLASAAPDFYRAVRLRHHYEELPADRGGKNGPKGKARAAWLEAEAAAMAIAEA